MVCVHRILNGHVSVFILVRYEVEIEVEQVRLAERVVVPVEQGTSQVWLTRLKGTDLLSTLVTVIGVDELSRVNPEEGTSWDLLVAGKDTPPFLFRLLNCHRDGPSVLNNLQTRLTKQVNQEKMEVKEI